MNSFVAKEQGRADKVIANALKLSRNQIEKLIESGLVSVNGDVLKKTSHKIEMDDIVGYHFLEAHKSETIEVNFDVTVLYEDEYLLVVNKPSGLVVHPAPSVKEATLVDWLKQRGVSLSTISGEERHGIVHRIDKETTGALVVAKTNEVHEALSVQLEDKSMGRYYVAIIDYPLKESCEVEANIARSPTNRLKMGVVEGGKYAKSAFAKIAQSENSLELIGAKLFTGRTHQIRVHLAQLGRHILGDTLYGYRDKEIPRVFLHAALLYFVHPISKKMIEIEAPIFDDMRDFLDTNFSQNYRELIESKQLKKVFDATH